MNKFKYAFIALMAFSFASCGSDEKVKEAKVATTTDQKVELTNLINRLEGEMHRSMKIDNVIAGQALQAYSDFSKNYPNDSITPDYLFKAGEIATAIQQYPQALAYYQLITQKYPNYKLVQESLFLQAALLDNFLNDDAKAKVIYEQLIKAYPKSTYVNDAKAAINNLGKTDEQLIKEFQKKNGEK
ncbi:MAG: tetratricopeptide repeat protein [Bacteroidetes bacterium]|nr:tetratricopeptide repeat protein [Bacteroidota bacterium]